MLEFLASGLSGWPWWGAILAALLFTHITIASVTIFLHRAQTHRALTLGSTISHFFRFWLWLTTGMVTREWVALHRKHHAFSDREGDPHSPLVFGIRKVFLQGAELYRTGCDDQSVVEKYGHGTPDDWLERRVYAASRYAGIVLMLVINLLVFGVIGLTVWAIQMIWIPFFAAGVINGLGHYWGYRNFECADRATNLVPWGILIGGEELHNNHHAFPSSAKLSSKPWEFDIGWFYIRLLERIGQAKVKKVAPQPVVIANKNIDIDTVRAVIVGRLHVMSDYFSEVLAKEGVSSGVATMRSAKRLMLRSEEQLNDSERDELEQLLASNQRLRVAYEYRSRLEQLWGRTTASHEALLQSLQDWCADAEATGVKHLESFARQLRGYSLSPAC